MTRRARLRLLLARLNGRARHPKGDACEAVDAEGATEGRPARPGPVATEITMNKNPVNKPYRIDDFFRQLLPADNKSRADLKADIAQHGGCRHPVAVASIAGEEGFVLVD